MQVLITVLAFLSVAGLALVLFGLVFSEERKVARALKSVSEWEGQQAAEAEPLLQPFGRRVISPAAGAVGKALRSVLPANSRKRTQKDLDLAGNPRGLTPEGLLGYRIVGAVVLPIAVFFVLVSLGAASGIYLLFIVLAAGAGWALPAVWLDSLRRRRQALIRRALPDMLDMLTISVQAGLGFDMALVKLVRSTTGPLAQEFGRMLNEVQAGVSRRDGLRHLGERTDIPELNNFIMAMIQADVFGVSVASILRAQADEMRTRRRQNAEEVAQKAPVKMVFPTVLCLLPSTLLVILGPAAIAIARAFGFI